MKYWLKLFSVLAVTAFITVAFCYDAVPNRYAHIRAGMTADDVASVMGRPPDGAGQHNGRSWQKWIYYRRLSDDLGVQVDYDGEGRLVKKSFVKFRSEKPYAKVLDQQRF